MKADSSSRFGSISIINHWTLALLVIAMLIVGVILDEMTNGPDKNQLRSLHKSVGVIVLFLGFWRVAWRIKQGFPQAIEGAKNWEKHLARVTHITLLCVIILMPVSGYVSSEAAGHAVSFFGLFNLPALPDSKALAGFAHDTHGVVGKIAIALIVFHFAAAIKHHFINKDSTLHRMIGRAPKDS